MGVSGCGKTTIGRALAACLGWRFRDGDEFHSPANIEKMRAGEPLDDTDRAPWLASIARWMDARSRDGVPAVVACSALKRRYRDFLRNTGRRHGSCICVCRAASWRVDCKRAITRTCPYPCWTANCKPWKNRTPTNHERSCSVPPMTSRTSWSLPCANCASTACWSARRCLVMAAEREPFPADSECPRQYDHCRHHEYSAELDLGAQPQPATASHSPVSPLPIRSHRGGS